MKAILLCAALLPILAACASGPEASATPSNAAGYEERQAARTGSNVSRRSRAPAPENAPAAK
jgi:hypothetical protein